MYIFYSFDEDFFVFIVWKNCTCVKRCQCQPVIFSNLIPLSRIWRGWILWTLRRCITAGPCLISSLLQVQVHPEMGHLYLTPPSSPGN